MTLDPSSPATKSALSIREGLSHLPSLMAFGTGAMFLLGYVKRAIVLRNLGLSASILDPSFSQAVADGLLWFCIGLLLSFIAVAFTILLSESFLTSKKEISEKIVSQEFLNKKFQILSDNPILSLALFLSFLGSSLTGYIIGYDIDGALKINGCPDCFSITISGKVIRGIPVGNDSSRMVIATPDGVVLAKIDEIQLISPPGRVVLRRP